MDDKFIDRVYGTSSFAIWSHAEGGGAVIVSDIVPESEILELCRMSGVQPVDFFGQPVNQQNLKLIDKSHSFAT